MAKKSRALRELEAMEHLETKELELADVARQTIAARLDTIQTLKRKLEGPGSRQPVKPKRKPSNHDKAVKILDEAAAAGIRQRNVAPAVSDMAAPASLSTIAQ